MADISGSRTEDRDRAAHESRRRMWHIDTTVIRLLNGTRAYLHAVIDNFSRRILACRVADAFAPVNSVDRAARRQSSRGAPDPAPVVLADAGVENVNAQVHDRSSRECCACPGLHGTDVLEHHDQGVVALPEH
jgi:transposase InsO family protein